MTNNEWPSGGGCCCCCSCCCSGLAACSLRCCCCCCSQAALPFPDLPFVCSFTFFIVSAAVVVAGLTALCLVDFSCVWLCVCVCVRSAAAAAIAQQQQKQLQLRLRCRWKVLSKMLPKCLTFCTVSVASCECVCPRVHVRVCVWPPGGPWYTDTATTTHPHTHTDTCK